MVCLSCSSQFYSAVIGVAFRGKGFQSGVPDTGSHQHSNDYPDSWRGRITYCGGNDYTVIHANTDGDSITNTDSNVDAKTNINTKSNGDTESNSNAKTNVDAKTNITTKTNGDTESNSNTESIGYGLIVINAGSVGYTYGNCNSIK